MAGNVLMHSRAKQNLYGTQQAYTHHGFLSLHVPSLFVHVSVFEHVWGKKKTKQKTNKINVTEKALLLSDSIHR